MKKTKQVLLVDPSPVYSTGLKTILSGHQDLTVAAMVHEVGSALQIARLQTIDLAIIELALTLIQSISHASRSAPLISHVTFGCKHSRQFLWILHSSL